MSEVTKDSNSAHLPVEVPQLDSKYECPICLSLLKDPVLTSCGHHFCTECINSWLSDKSNSCPIDGQKLNAQVDLFPDLSTRREIQFTKTRCSVCNLSLSFSELDTHQQVHSKGEASSDMECYRTKGGEMNGSTSMADSDLQEVHSKSALNSDSVQESSGRDTQALTQESKFWEPDSKTSKTQDENEVALLPLLKSLYERIVVLEQRSFEQKAYIEKLKSELQTVTTKLNNVNLQHSNGEHLWTVSNFREKLTSMARDKTVMFYSEGFYTSPVGYKVCARLNMSANVNGHLTLVIHMMKNAHDWALDWPFNGRITLTLIHPVNSALNIKETMISRPELDAFKKPVHDMNRKAFGYTEFISIQDVLSMGYLVNDELHIKISVQCV